MTSPNPWRDACLALLDAEHRDHFASRLSDGELAAVDAMKALLLREERERAYCEDCRLLYVDFPIDVVLPDADWLRVHPEGPDGLLCAGCIARRADKIPDAILVHARVVLANDHDAFAACKNVPTAELFRAWARAAAAESER